jgi:hypothetical protein
MSILERLNSLLSETNTQIETGVFTDIPPDEYLVITPLVDTLDLYADNLPLMQMEEARISLFTKKNYIGKRNQLTRLLLRAGFLITDRRYLGFENDTKYHHYAIDVMKENEMEGE